MSTESKKAAALATELSHIARTFEAKIQTVNLPVQRGSTVLFDSIAEAFAAGAASVRGDTNGSTYGTVGLSTSIALMDAVAAIEGRGHATKAALMPSGLNAIATAMLAFLEAGDHLLVIDSVYGPTRIFCDSVLAKLNILTTYYSPTSSAAEIAAMVKPNTRVLYMESPGSYTFEIQDVPAICEAITHINAKRVPDKQVVTMIDNAWGSPMFANAFDWGVDVSILPLTKYWSGHSDVLMGAVIVRDHLWQKLWQIEKAMGVCVSGDDAYLILRGIRTVAVRMQQQQQTSLTVANWLQSHPLVKSVLYPALESHPQHEIWKRDFSGASGLFSFELKPHLFENLSTEQHWAKMGLLCNGRAYFGIGYSWGGYESLIMPARIDNARSVKKWQVDKDDRKTQNGPLVRLQIGLENAQDLINDLRLGFELLSL
jgi:cysteine-S-conjugate beta-lyase